MSLYWGRLGEESLLCSFDYHQEISNAAYAVSSYVGVDWHKRHRSKAFIMCHQEIVDAVSSGYVAVDWDASCSTAFIVLRKLLTLC